MLLEKIVGAKAEEGADLQSVADLARDVNANVRSDPRMPFGGVKESGYGREGGRQGLEAYLDV